MQDTQVLVRFSVTLAQGVQRGNRRVVDKAQMAAIKGHFGRVAGRVELFEKGRRRSKKQRAVDPVQRAAVTLKKRVVVQL